MTSSFDGTQQTQTLESLVTRKIVAEECLKNLGEVELLADDALSFDRVLAALNAAGHLSSFQLAKIGDEGIDALRFGPYVLLDLLGRGGMGEVLLARHVELDRKVALKVLPPNLTDSAERRERFRREVKLLAKLDHPGIVKAVDAGHHGDVPYLAMEYLPGGTLQDVLANEGAIGWNRLIRWMIPICEALDYAHQQGIIHRDIKPSNLAIDQYQGIKILDLGLARAISYDPQGTTEGFATSADQMLGTVDFMPPEQSAGDVEVGPTADIYSLGCTIFTLLTSRSVFPGRSVLEKVMAHRRDAPPTIVDFRPEVPVEFDALYHRMVAKDPAARPQTMREVAQRLGEIAEQYQLSDSTVPGPMNQTETEPFAAPELFLSTSPRKTVGLAASVLNDTQLTKVTKSVNRTTYIVGGASAFMVLLTSATAILLLNRDTPADRQQPRNEAIDAANSALALRDLKPRPDASTQSDLQQRATEKSKGQASVASTILLAGGEVSVANKSTNGRFEVLAVDELPKSIPAGSRFNVRFANTAPTPALLNLVVELESLELLEIRSRTPDSISLKTIGSSEWLENLVVDAQSFPAADLVWLRKALALRSLTIFAADRPVVERLVGLEQLENLSLPMNRFGPGAVNILQKMSWLQTLALRVDDLNSDALTSLIEANPNCKFIFSHSRRTDYSKLLVDLSKKVGTAEGKAVVDQMLDEDREWLFSHPSMEAIHALEHHRREFPFGFWSKTDDEKLIQRGQRLLEQDVVTIDALHRADPQSVKTWHINRTATDLKLLGHLFEATGRREEALAAYKASFDRYSQLASPEYQGLLANGAYSVYRNCDTEAEKARWLQLTRYHLDQIDPKIAIRIDETWWAARDIHQRLRPSDPQHAVRYSQLAAQLVSDHWNVQSVGKEQAETWLIDAETKLMIGDLQGANASLEQHDLLMAKLPQEKWVQELELKKWGRQIALAILSNNRQAFLEATNALAEYTGGIDGADDYSCWDFLMLRGWCNPLSVEKIQLPAGDRNGIGGDVPPVAFEMSQGNVSSAWLRELAPPPDSDPRHAWYLALQLRLEAGQTPTSEQQLEAEQLWRALPQSLDWNIRALVAGLLGPLTGNPLTEITSWKSGSSGGISDEAHSDDKFKEND